MARKFTRDELIEAWAQMEEEAAEAMRLAQRAAEWLQDKCGLVVHPSRANAYTPVKWYPMPPLALAISYCYYDNINQWLKSRLTDIAPPVGFNVNTKGFTLDLGPDEGFPAGTSYFVYLSTYDPHVGGF